MLTTAELLRSKAMLLLRREREVHDYRRERVRIEQWLRVFHKLSQHLQPGDEPQLSDQPALLNQWVSAMVGDLSFQVACVYAHKPDTGKLELLSGLAPSDPVRVIMLEPMARAHIAAQPSGLFTEGLPETMRSFAASAGLGRCYWHWAWNHGQPLLLVAGYELRTLPFYAINQEDAPHFTLLGNHLGAVLENAALIAELDREKSELHESNRQLDVTVQRLREAQDNLVKSTKLLAETSRRAGMADIATGVLHNVGNALNSVNVSAEVLANRVRGLKVSALVRVAELLATHADDLPSFLTTDERGKKIVPFLGELGKHLTGEADGLTAETTALLEHIDHIKAIVSKQQTYAMSFDMSQPCKPSELVDDALALCGSSLSRHGVQVSRDHADLPEMLLDRHKILQILVNLVTNAKQSLAASRQAEKRIWTEVKGAGERVRIVVRDNGSGIAQEHLEQIFRHGFTTKRDGHGFGLHACALAAQDMGGSITCASDGPERGATFTLELPVRRNGTSLLSAAAAVHG